MIGKADMLTKLNARQELLHMVRSCFEVEIRTALLLEMFGTFEGVATVDLSLAELLSLRVGR